MAFLLLGVLVFIGVKFVVAPMGSSKIEKQKKSNPNRINNIQDKALKQFHELSEKRNIMISEIEKIVLPESLFSEALEDLDKNAFEISQYNDLAAISRHIQNNRLDFKELKEFYRDNEVFNTSKFPTPASLPPKYTIKLKDGRMVGINDSVITEVNQFHKICIAKQKYILSVELMGTLLIQALKANDKFQFAELRSELDDLGIFHTNAEKTMINSLNDLAQTLSSIESQMMTQSNILLRGFSLLDSRLNGIENKLASIDSHNKVQTYLNAYNVYQTNQIRKSLSA